MPSESTSWNQSVLDILRRFRSGEEGLRLNPKDFPEGIASEIAEEINGLLADHEWVQKVNKLGEDLFLHRRVLQNSPFEVVIIDQDFRFLFVNEVAVKNPEVRSWLIGKTDLDYCRHRNKPIRIAEERLALYRQVIRSKKSHAVEQEMTDQEGNKRFYLRSVNPLFDPEGEVEMLVGFGIEVTSVKKASLELVDLNRELERTNRELDQFVYRASHDLRGPVTSMQGLLNLIDSSDISPEAEYFLDLMQRTTSKMDTFIRNLIEYAHNIKQPAQISPISLKTEIPNILDRLLPPNTDNISIHQEIQEEHPFISDPERVRIILNNLISNAIKFKKAETQNHEVKIRVASKPEQVEIEVSDNGIGIAKEQQDKVFNMFFRATANNSGSGLGLFIARESVKVLKGKLELDSFPNAGSTFRLILPNLSSHQNAGSKGSF